MEIHKPTIREVQVAQHQSRGNNQVSTFIVHHQGGSGINNLPNIFASRNVSYHAAGTASELHKFVPFDRAAWHAGRTNPGIPNQNNTSIGYCFSGNFENTDAEWRAYLTCALFYLEACEHFGRELEIKLHRDVSATACPGTISIKRVKEAIEQIRGVESFVNDIEEAIQELSGWRAKAVKRATELGISDGTRPSDNVTRVEVMQMLLNLYDLLKTEV